MEQHEEVLKGVRSSARKIAKKPCYVESPPLEALDNIKQFSSSIKKTKSSRKAAKNVKKSPPFKVNTEIPVKRVRTKRRIRGSSVLFEFNNESVEEASVYKEPCKIKRREKLSFLPRIEDIKEVIKQNDELNEVSDGVADNACHEVLDVEGSDHLVENAFKSDMYNLKPLNTSENREPVDNQTVCLKSCYVKLIPLEQTNILNRRQKLQLKLSTSISSDDSVKNEMNHNCVRLPKLSIKEVNTNLENSNHELGYSFVGKSPTYDTELPESSIMEISILAQDSNLCNDNFDENFIQNNCTSNYVETVHANLCQDTQPGHANYLHQRLTEAANDVFNSTEDEFMSGIDFLESSSEETASSKKSDRAVQNEMLSNIIHDRFEESSKGTVLELDTDFSAIKNYSNKSTLLSETEKSCLEHSKKSAAFETGENGTDNISWCQERIEPTPDGERLNIHERLDFSNVTLRKKVKQNSRDSANLDLSAEPEDIKEQCNVAPMDVQYSPPPASLTSDKMNDTTYEIKDDREGASEVCNVEGSCSLPMNSQKLNSTFDVVEDENLTFDTSIKENFNTLVQASTPKSALKISSSIFGNSTKSKPKLSVRLSSHCSGQKTPVSINKKDQVIRSTPKPRKMPNFAKIHENMYNKIENIQEYTTRKENRARLLVSGHAPDKISKVNISTSSTTKKLRTNEKRQSLSEKRQSLVEKRQSLVEKRQSLVEKRQSLVEKRRSLNDKRQSLREKSIVNGNNIIAKKLNPIDNSNIDSKLNCHLKMVHKQQLKRVVATKTRILKTDLKKDQLSVIKGVRSNRRFDLLMSMRQKNNA